MNKGDISKNMYEAGRYFIEAESWYKSMYLSSKITRNLYLFICLILIFAICISFFVIRSFYPMQQKAIMIVKGRVRESSDKNLLVKLEKYSHPTLSVAKMMMSEYIEAREGYQYDGISSIGLVQDRIKKIESMSHKDVFLEYRRSTDQLDDLMYLFQNKIGKEVKIESVIYDSGYSFFDTFMYMITPGKIPSSASVFITQSVKGVVTKYLIKIDFYIKIPAVPTDDASDNAENIQGGGISIIPSKISDLKAYLTGLNKTFDPRIEFVILGYSKTKTI